MVASVLYYDIPWNAYASSELEKFFQPKNV